MLNSPIFVPIFVLSVVASVFLFFWTKDKIQDFFEQKRLTHLKSLKMSECGPCRNYEIWKHGDEIHYQIDENETGAANLVVFHPEKVVVRNNDRKILLDPYLVVRNRSAEEREHIQRGMNYQKALNSSNGENSFLLAAPNLKEERYEEIS